MNFLSYTFLEPKIKSLQNSFTILNPVLEKSLALTAVDCEAGELPVSCHESLGRAREQGWLDSDAE